VPRNKISMDASTNSTPTSSSRPTSCTMDVDATSYTGLAHAVTAASAHARGIAHHPVPDGYSTATSERL
jgi:hypothetical protein